MSPLRSTLQRFDLSNSALLRLFYRFTLTDGTNISADYAITTFSLGVLQNDDVRAGPPYLETGGMAMGTYTKIFLQFEDKFWFDTQFALYADRERGRYPWQGLDIQGFLPGSGIVFATVTRDFSERIDAMTDAEVQAEILEVLQTMFPRWFSDPLYRDSFSNWPSGFVSPHHANVRANVGQRLWFSDEGRAESTSVSFIARTSQAWKLAQESQMHPYGCVRKPALHERHALRYLSAEGLSGFAVLGHPRVCAK
ncbi:hypothetical protein GGX14DRAFT_561547 [Mycena pura]|uniref:Amine oxidase domain-containing protein n=1 Tax=Mycena pura TaxID=153505 RepID=A0AAD6VMZ7_9AGAR|nr:hypothetical protein GGX14DRAFT_561547 [Mycena pura]